MKAPQADASVEVPKLHNIKLLMMKIFNFTACRQNP